MAADAVPRSARSWKKRVAITRRRTMASLGFGTFPEFLIVGAQRCGTSSLYACLTSHPRVRAALRKEVHFFDKNYSQGMGWYQGFFPLSMPITTRRWITGEATPYYLFHPHALERIKSDLPAIKLIVQLRNPVDRAYSHYLHAKRHGYEQLDFAEAIKRERATIELETTNLVENPELDSFDHQRRSYLHRGCYDWQIERLLNLFPRDQLFLVKSEEFFQSSWPVLRRVLDFLGIQSVDWEIEKLPRKNHLGQYEPMDARIRHELEEFFAASNARLEDVLKQDMSWNKAA